MDNILDLRNNDPNKSTKNLHDTVNYILDELAPYKKLNKYEIQLKKKPWINAKIQFLMWERDKLFKKYCKSNNVNIKERLYSEYKKIRNNLTTLKRNSKIKYYQKYFKINAKKTAAIWKGIRSLITIKKTNRKNISTIESNGDVITDPVNIANAFNKYFVNVGPTVESKIPASDIPYTEYLKKSVKNSFYLSPVKTYEISDIIKSLDLNKSLGPNSIPIFILKLCQGFFSTNLEKIINLSFKTGIFPELCKIAKVIPIFKKENPLLCKNYRPISLLPIFSKIFEKLIYIRMYKYLDTNNLLYDKQFGFRSKHSTNHALISLTESIKKHLDNKELVSGIFIDLAKAFDTVNHKILCNKLSYYGFRGKFNDLIKSFLSNRKQYVSINGFDSDKLEISCGVPQGSTLGPLLFVLYINDLQYSLKFASANHFADDTCLLYANKKPKTVETNLNFDLKSLNQWLCANRLSLNIDKTRLLLFHSKYDKKEIDINIKMKGVRLEPSHSVKYLGIHLDENLSWDIHIKELRNKLSRANGIISKLRHYVPKSTIMQIYYSLFFSHLTYGILVWSLTTQKNLDIISILQRKSIRIMNSVSYDEHTNDLFYENKIIKFIDIIKMNQILFALEFKIGTLPKDLKSIFIHTADIHSHNTRASNTTFSLPLVSTTNFGTLSLNYQVPYVWNEFSKVYTENCQQSYKSLKKFIKMLFLDKYFEESKA